MKKLLLTLLCTTAVTTAFADGFSNNVGGVPNLGIYNGTSFNSLPSTSELRKFAKATVGFKFVVPETDLHPELVSACTGVAIANNLLLTANHCTVSNKGVKYFDAGKVLYLYITGTSDEGMLKTPDIVKVIRANPNKSTPMEDYEDILGDDIAIIKFPNNTFKDFIPSNKILANSDLIPADVAVDKLMSVLYDSTRTIGVLGWGSHKKFQAGIAPVRNTSGNALLTFHKNLNRDKGNIIPTYNQKDAGNHYGDYIPSLTGTTYTRKAAQNSTTATFTNAVFYKDSSQDSIVEQGDSGGPIYTCDKTSNACWLIGINTANSLQGVSVFTTLANPFFDLIYDAAKK